MNKKNIEKIIKELLIEIGEDPKREGLKDTPKRIANLYEELLNGNQEDPKEILNVTYSTKQDEMIIVKDIPLYSLCEHHLLPFFGKCHIAYIPRNGKVVGLSKLARIVSLYSKRLQLQERITTQIADTIMQELKPFGVGVIIKAKHMCMEMRGAKAFDSSTITSALRGSFKKDIRTREEFLELIKNVD